MNTHSASTVSARSPKSLGLTFFTKRKCLATVMFLSTLLPLAAEIPWSEVLNHKQQGLRSAAQRAIEQQRVGHQPSREVPFTASGVGNVEVEKSGDWDATGDGQSYRVTYREVPRNTHNRDIRDRIRIEFPEPLNVLELGTGFALWVNAPEATSGDLRMGVLFHVEGTDPTPVVFADTPVRQRFGDNPHLVYFDWGYVFAHGMGIFETPDREDFTKITAIELTLVQKRLPAAPADLEPVSGEFHFDGFAFVDWFDGSYDNSRFRGGEINVDYPLVAQGRTQQVALIAAQFGGEAGIQSAIRAMDMMARIQSWDGSWPEMRTRMQGEYTHGMIAADLARALAYMREQDRPELEEVVKIRHWEMSRDQLYEQMLYRSAMSRSPGPFSDYRDSYVNGRGSLTGGANRPMVFALSQFEVAEILTDPARKAEVMAEYDKNMDDIVAAQGVTAGGWPIFGEGNRHGGRGLHFDAGYTTDHVAIITNAIRVTGDPRWKEILKRFDEVVRVMVLPDGLRFDGAISERGSSDPKGLKAADIVFQEGLAAEAPYTAQWGANVSRELWQNRATVTLWPSTRSFRGYALGAFLTWQVYDMREDPEPVDLGVVFPRQWPVWTAAWFNKEGEQVRQSKIIARPDGQLVNTFAWEIGQYPVLTAAPIQVSVQGKAAVELLPVLYEGNVRELPADAKLTVASGPIGGELDAPEPLQQDKATFTLPGPTQVVIQSPDQDFQIVFHATPRIDKEADQGADPGETRLDLTLLRAPVPYEHLYAVEDAADAALDKAGTNMADPASGSTWAAIECFPNQQYGIDRALDGNPGTSWVIGNFKAKTGLRVTFPREVKLDRLVLAQGDWQNTFQLASEISVTLSDGTKHQLKLEPAPGKNVTLDLKGARSKNLTLMVESLREQSEPRPHTGGWSNLEILTAAP